MALVKSNSSNPSRQGGHARGFSLVEVVVSMGIFTAVTIGVAQLFAVAGKANLVARGLTTTTAMAEQKMEQLRSMTWGFATDGTGLPVSDSTSNLSVTPATATGSGLNPSPTNALDENVPGFCDFLDANGVWVGTGTTIPVTATYIRRWTITPLPTNPNNTLILQVLVTTVLNERSRGDGVRTRMAGDSVLLSVKTRKAL